MREGCCITEVDMSLLGELSDDLRLEVEQAETPEDLVALAKEQGIELSEEQLDQIAAGGVWSDERKCPECGSTNIVGSRTKILGTFKFVCEDCGAVWPPNVF